ncbi:peptide ABC transporter substrate-binding protein [uncultured Brachyspira sp.]|uniref:peptide ABC transporter substrate-binding protein n=2 Tax=uncultured Brachyspira sp. TaxID=221953 RepID=UPI0025F73E1D|nr:peptide ABC transporter substrate-binding protein [uncultured Brachyspira sp.]
MKRILIILSVIVLITASCSETSSKNNSLITVNLGPEPKTMDPTLNSINVVSSYILHAFEGLTKIDSNNNVQSGMAESWDISEDGKVYTFHLRTNALWSDGKPVTADDFEYSWKRAVDPNTAAEYSYMMEIVKNAEEINAGIISYTNLSAKSIDDYTFQVELVNPTAYFLEFIASTGVFVPVRKDIIEQYGDSWTLSPETYICNGPYKMKERIIDEKIVFDINTNYYAKDEQIADEINFVLMSDPNTAIAGIRGGNIHFSALEPPSAEIETLKNDGYIAANNAIGTYYIELNITNKAFEDKRVRQALSLAIDRNYIVKNVTKGGQVPAGAFVPTEVRGLRTTFRNENKEYIDVDNYEANVQKAKKLMADAGYPNGNNYPVIELKVSPGIYVLVGEAIQQMWKENLNVSVYLVQEEFPITLQFLIEKDYQMARMGWTGDYNDPMTMLDVMISYGGINHTGFASKEYDNNLLIAKRSADNAVRMSAMAEAENILMDNMPIIPLYYRADSFIKNPKLNGVVLNPLGRHKFNYAYINRK